MSHLPNHPGATLVRVEANDTRILRQRPIKFANHRTVAEVDAGQLISRANDIFIPIAAAPSAGEGGRPAAPAPCGGSLANVSRPGADVSLSHEEA